MHVLLMGKRELRKRFVSWILSDIIRVYKIMCGGFLDQRRHKFREVVRSDTMNKIVRVRACCDGFVVIPTLIPF